MRLTENYNSPCRYHFKESCKNPDQVTHFLFSMFEQVNKTFAEETEEKKVFLQEQVCLMMEDKTLEMKDLQKLHQFLGHCPVEKVEKLIKRAGKLTTEIQNNLGKIKEDCGACSLFQNRKPVPATLIPKVMKHNQIVTINLKESGEGKYRCFT